MSCAAESRRWQPYPLHPRPTPAPDSHAAPWGAAAQPHGRRSVCSHASPSSTGAGQTALQHTRGSSLEPACSSCRGAQVSTLQSGRFLAKRAKSLLGKEGENSTTYSSTGLMSLCSSDGDDDEQGDRCYAKAQRRVEQGGR